MGITSAIFQALGKLLWENDPLIRLAIIGTVTGELAFKTLVVTLSYPGALLDGRFFKKWKSESLPLPNWYYNKYTQRALHQTKMITVVNFLTLVLCSFGRLISLVINKSWQWLTLALKSSQKWLSCSRGFTVSVTTIDLLKLYL